MRSVAFIPDGKSVASGSFVKTVKIWDVETGLETLTLKGHLGPVYRASFSPEGKRIVSGSSDRTIKIWDSRSINEHVQSNPDGR